MPVARSAARLAGRAHGVAAAIVWGFAAACGGSGDADEPGNAPYDLLGLGASHPFPNAGLVEDGAVRIDPADFPLGGTPLRVERLASRRGFSPTQTSVLCWPGLVFDDLPDASTSPEEGSVGLFDLTAERWLRRLAERDQAPDAVDPCLLVRPLEAVPDGHDVAVVVASSVMARPDTYASLMASGSTLKGSSYAMPDLLSILEENGFPTDQVGLAWDYPVDSGRGQLESALTWAAPGDWALDEVRDADEGAEVPPLTWRAAEGEYEVASVLDAGQGLRLGSDGLVNAKGTVQAHLYVHVPDSVRGAEPGSVPVLLFGHGIFGAPEVYLDDESDPSRVLDLADRAGMVVVATRWTGLSMEERGALPEIALDPARIHEIPDQLIQAQVNVAALIANLKDGTLSNASVFQDASGRSLIDGQALYYYGISLGAIEGAVLLAQRPPLQAAVFHVGGSVWSTMLERSFHWSLFEPFVEVAVPDPGSRQRFYALSQLYWDPVDPASWTDRLEGQSYLLQIAVGDEQVPNLTSEVWARSSGLPVLEPAVSVPPGVHVVEAPLPPASSAMVQFDPELTVPEESNRPAPLTGAHEAPRQWDGALLQVLDHFELGSEGQVIHHCGAGPCSASNQGG